MNSKPSTTAGSIRPLYLMQTAIDPNDPLDPTNAAAVAAMMADTQGNILKSHGRNHSYHLFFWFDEDQPEAARAWVRAVVAPRVTSAMQQWQDAAAFRAAGVDGGTFVNFALSANGYRKLGFDGANIPNDPSFLGGARGSIDTLNDPPIKQWQRGFQRRLDALLILADDNHDRLQAGHDEILASLGAFGDAVECVFVETGVALRLDASGQAVEDKTTTVHEHFGYSDGVSQPLFFAKDIEESRLNSGGFDQYDPSAPLGLVLVKDPNGGAFGYGSYLVYRKLRQDVHRFKQSVAELAARIVQARDPKASPTDADLALAEAYVMGRFKDGTPVAQQAVDGWTNEPNNWNYDQDVDGLKCPYHAHTRKTNPRGDKARAFSSPLTEESSRRIARRAISFGPLDIDPPEGEEVGLLFICMQSSIVDQFEFMQAQWSNNEQFLHQGTGLDPVIGQAPVGQAPATPQHWPKVYGQRNDFNGADPFVAYQFAQWVTMLGGEYFFVPSVGFLGRE